MLQSRAIRTVEIPDAEVVRVLRGLSPGERIQLAYDANRLVRRAACPSGARAPRLDGSAALQLPSRNACFMDDLTSFDSPWMCSKNWAADVDRPSARPPQAHDFLAQFRTGRGGHSRPEQIEAQDFVAQGLSPDRPESAPSGSSPAGKTPDRQRRRPAAPPAARWTGVPQNGVPSPRSKAGSPAGTCVRTLMSCPVPPAGLRWPRNHCNLRVIGDPPVIVVVLVDVAGLGPQQALLHPPQGRAIRQKAQQHRLQPRGPSVILLVGIGWRGRSRRPPGRLLQERL